MSCRPSILIFHPALAPYRVDLFNELAQACRLRIAFLVDHLRDNPVDQDSLRRNLVADHELMTTGTQVAGYALRLGYARRIREFRPEIVVTSEFGTATIATSWWARVGPDRFAHVVWTDDNPESIRRDSRRKRMLRRLLLPGVSGLVTVSDEAARLYREQFRFGNPIARVPILQCERTFRSALERTTEDARQLAHRQGLEGRRVLLFVGRLVPEKGIAALLDEFAATARTSPDAHLVIVGEGPCRSELEARCRALGIAGRVSFVGHAQREVLLTWYRIGGSLVLPSLYEPYGAVVNEALLSGLHVACSRFAGARGLISPPRNDLIFDPTEPGQLRAAIAEVLARSAVVSPGTLSRLRPSAMTVRFEQATGGFLDLLAELRQPLFEVA